MTAQLSPLPVFRAWDNLGFPLFGGKLFSYIAGTVTKQATYTDSTQTTPNSNPIILNYRGEAQVWLDPTKSYKLVLAPANDTDPPTNPFWTVDQISGGQLSPSGSIIPTVNNLFTLGNSSFSWANAYFGANGLALIDAGGNAGFVARTAAEITASVTPTDYFYPEGDLRRYGGDPTGVVDASTAWQAAINVGIARLAKGCSYKIVTPATKTGQVTILGEGKSSKLLSDSTVLTVTSGTGSLVDNFWMENITAPWIISRNANWTAPNATFASLQQSNTVLGYQPTSNDADIWSANTFTANQTGGTDTMTVTVVPGGNTVQPGATLSGTGVAAGTSVLRQLTGSATLTGTYQVSNTTGFASTSITTLALTSPQQSQQIGPKILFQGAATAIEVSRIAGRFVLVEVRDASYSVIRDCNVIGGKGVWGTLIFDNGANHIQGLGNALLNNVVRYGSFSGLGSFFNDGTRIEGNLSEFVGESGIKAGANAGSGGKVFSVRSQIIGNICRFGYYDGIDTVTDVPTSNTNQAFHLVSGNICENNNGTGVNLDGLYNTCIGNTFQGNGRFGIWCTGDQQNIIGNYCNNNNVLRNASNSEILGGGNNNVILGNVVYMLGDSNSESIRATNTHYIANNRVTSNGSAAGRYNFGSPITSLYSNNVDDSTGLQTEQSFIWGINNNAGTLQHTTYAQSGSATLGNYQNRILNASAAPVNTPTGPDATTALAGGWKIGSASTNNIWADTNDQLGFVNALMACAIAYNDTGNSIFVRPQIVSININGVTRFRLTFQFFTTTGAAFALTAANIPAGKTIQVQFYGRLT